MCKLEDSTVKSVLSFHHMVPKDQTWIIKLGGKNHLTTPKMALLNAK